MRQCIELAKLARQNGDTPVGSIIVRDGNILAEGIEAVKTKFDITAHAEIEAIRRACRTLNSLDLRDCALYTTAEPCWMCSYAIRKTGISRVFIGAAVPQAGGASSHYPILTDSAISRWPTVPDVSFGVLREACECLTRRPEP